MVVFTPFNPVGPENPDNPWIEQAYHHETFKVFPLLSRAVSFARRAVRTDFFGEVTVEEINLIDPNKPHLGGNKVEGGFEAVFH